MASPSNKTPPEVEAECVRLIREGKTRPEVEAATGVSRRVLSRIARDAGVEFQRVGSGSSGTPEAMAKARSYQSEYAKNRRNELADKLLDQIARGNELALNETDPRKFQFLMQAVDAATRAYDKITKTDQAGDSGFAEGKSALEKVLEAALAVTAMTEANGLTEKGKAGYVDPNTGKARRHDLIQQ